MSGGDHNQGEGRELDDEAFERAYLRMMHKRNLETFKREIYGTWTTPDRGEVSS